MRKNPFKEHVKILLLCLSILLICAMVQYGNFSGLMQQEIELWYENSRAITAQYNELKRDRANIVEQYGEDMAYEIEKSYDDNFVKYKDSLFGKPPILTVLLSRTMNTPLIISTIILLAVLIIMLIERDYRPNKSILTLLRLPRPRSRYLLSKLISPTALMFLFWGIQFWVAKMQTSHYFDAIPEALRPSNQFPWTFDYYRILYPVAEPIWFPATACALCMLPLIIVTIVFIAKGGMKSWVYGILPIVGAVTVALVVNRISNMWWLMPALLVAVYLNCKMLINKGQIV